MTDTPLTPAADEVPTTIKALNAKVDEIVTNGNEAIVAVRQVATARDRLRTAALLLAAGSIIGSGITGYTVHQRCEDNNKQNAAEIGLWEFIIQLTAGDPNPGVTPAQQERRLIEFRSFLHRSFPQRNCLL